MSIFNEIGKTGLNNFIDLCSNYLEIDKNKMYELASTAIKYYKGNKSIRKNTRIYQDLEKRWYKSLEENNPDYTIYSQPYFLSDIWACWIIYSRKYLLNINSEKSLAQKDSHLNYYNLKSIVQDIGNISTCIDLGCGFGYTTAGLKELFPKANIYGTNFKDSPQWKIATNIGNKYNFSLIENINKLNYKIDLVFASEYFEHIENLIEHLENIIDLLSPRYFIIANSFNSISVGHFLKFKNKNKVIDKKKIGKIFNNTLRINGYENIKTNCWNNRPMYWRKK